MKMALDLMIRGLGSNRAPNEHIGALPAEYQGWKSFLYGTPLVETAYPATADLNQLAGWIEAAGESNLLLYGDDALFQVVEPDAIGTVWVTMGADRDGVREVWRLRQQYGWLAKKKLALLVEPSEGGEKPDADRLMRLTRAVQVLTFTAGAAPTEPVWDSAPVEPTDETPAADVPQEPALETPAPTTTAADDGLSAAEMASLSASAAATVAPATEPAPAAAAWETPVAVAPTLEEPTLETEAPAPAALEETETPAPQIERGADLNMTTPQAEQAILQRYALVRERRTASARIQEVEAVINGGLKEIFVARFAGGVEAAAEFEARTKALAEASAEYNQLTQTLARIEEELAKLAWLKDELEI